MQWYATCVRQYNTASDYVDGVLRSISAVEYKKSPTKNLERVFNLFRLPVSVSLNFHTRVQLVLSTASRIFQRLEDMLVRRYCDKRTVLVSCKPNKLRNLECNGYSRDVMLSDVSCRSIDCWLFIDDKY